MSAGLFGVTAGLVGLAAIKLPKRGAFETVEEKLVDEEKPALEE
jgi:hypothetical protein